MKAIRAAACFRICQRRLQVVFAQKPFERSKCLDRPLRAVLRSPRGKACGDRCCRLDRLLVERFRLLAEPAEAFVPTGLKYPD